MPDIREVLKGLDPDHRAIYTEVRTAMRRAYLYAHSKILPIEQYEEADDYFLDLIDIKIAQLFDRAGTFNHVEGKLATEEAKEIETKIENDATKIESEATKMIKGWPTNGNGK